MVPKSDFKLVSCGSNVLNITFVTSDKGNYVYRFIMKVLSDILFYSFAALTREILFVAFFTDSIIHLNVFNNILKKL